jgi:hypothetical protein
MNYIENELGITIIHESGFVITIGKSDAGFIIDGFVKINKNSCKAPISIKPSSFNQIIIGKAK